jgi:hypothetical protein
MGASSISSSVKDFLRLANIGGSRSSILNQLQWTMVILIAGIVTLQFAHSSNWLTIFLAVLLALDILIFFIAFLYFMLKRPHSLRSETFDYKMSALIQKRAGEMEAGQYDEVSAVTELRVHLDSDSQPEDMERP